MRTVNTETNRALSLKYGIGRSISEESKREIKAAFRKSNGVHGTFSPRVRPGLTYLSPERMARDVGEHAINLNRTRLQEITDFLIQSLCDDGKLDASTAFDKVAVPLEVIAFKSVTSRELRAKVHDTENPFYENGFQLDGEKAVFCSETGYPYTSCAEGTAFVPKFDLKLGKLLGDFEDIAATPFPEVRGHIGKYVILDPIGLVTSS